MLNKVGMAILLEFLNIEVIFTILLKRERVIEQKNRWTISGIRILGRKVTDRLEAEALLFNNNHIDIYSASWGPNDDGRTVDGPRRLSQIALMNGIKFVSSFFFVSSL